MAESVDMKVVMLGDIAVGKTCIAARYVHDTFGSPQTTSKLPQQHTVLMEGTTPEPLC